MLTARVPQPAEVTDFEYVCGVFDLGRGALTELGARPVADDMDFLGGIGRSFKIVAAYQVSDPFAPASPLVVNTGCLTGTGYMTGLRTFFTAYSPLKRTRRGMPMPAWSAMSGCFGRKLRSTGIDDLVLVGRAATPQILVVRQRPDGPEVVLEPAPAELIGARTPRKVAWLNDHYNDPAGRRFPAQFAVLGPAGEHWDRVWYACIAGTTHEQLTTGEDKFRFAGRLGMGSVLGSKNVLAIVALAEEDVYLRGDDRLKPVNRQIGRGDQSKNYRHPDNYGGGGGTGRNERLLDGFGVLPFRNFAPTGENLAVATHLETVRESPRHIVVDKNCFGCQISCHQDVYAAPAEGKDPDLRQARRRHGPFLGRYEFEPMELTGPNLGNLDIDANLALSRLCDDVGLDAITTGVVLAYLMDYNELGGTPVAGDLRFGDVAGAARLMEDIAYGREPLLGRGVKRISEEIGGAGFAMHCKGVELSAYLGQTNPGYPFAVAGGHMSMRTFLLYVIDAQCQPGSADYWVEKITLEGWKMINNNLHGGCLFAMAPPAQVVEAIGSVYGVELSPERLLEATYRAHLMGFALEQRQGIAAEEYDLPAEVFVGQRKGDLPGVHFLTRELFEEVRGRVLERFRQEAARLGYLDSDPAPAPAV